VQSATSPRPWTAGARHRATHPPFQVGSECIMQPMSAFEWKDDSQIRTILRRNRRPELAAGFCPKADVCVRFHVDPERSCTSSGSESGNFESVSLSRPILHYKLRRLSAPSYRISAQAAFT
jgi:hypothetical protein